MAYKPLSSRTTLHDVAVHKISSHIRCEHEKHGVANLLLSGGSTPGPVYQNLSKMDLDWKNVNIGLADERWVHEDDSGSNAALIRRTLLQKKAKAANFIPMKTDDQTAKSGQDHVNAAYAKLITKNSLAVLGMGTDGHICSWFPQSVGLNRAVDPNNKNRVQAIGAKKSIVTGDYLERMTLTLSALSTCTSILLLITGDEKRNVIKRAFENNNTDLPISHLIHKVDPGCLTILHAA